MRGRLPGLGHELQVRQFAGGQSNPTYLLESGGQRFVLRKKPPGALLPTEHPFLYSVSCTATSGTALASLEAAADQALADVRANGITPDEFDRARHQLRARLVFEADSVTSIAHQIGYFHTVADVDVYHGMEGGQRAQHPPA